MPAAEFLLLAVVPAEEDAVGSRSPDAPLADVGPNTGVTTGDLRTHPTVSDDTWRTPLALTRSKRTERQT